MLSPFKHHGILFAQIYTAAVLQKAYHGMPDKSGIGHPTARQHPPESPPKANSGKPATTLEQLADDRPPWFKSLDKLHVSTLKHWENQFQCMQKQNDRYLKYLRAREKRLEKQVAQLTNENRDLYVQSHRLSLRISFLIFRQAAFLRERNERRRWDSTFNVRGAIEKIVEKAVKQKMMTGGGGVQEGIDKIMELKEFRAILLEEVESRNLKELDIRRCLSIIYPALSRYVHGNDSNIVLRGFYHPDNERARLVVLMRVQGRWRSPLAWKEKATEAHYYTKDGQTT